MIKAILFDLDGVIVHVEQFSSYLEREHHISQATTLPFFAGEFQDCLIGKADLKETVAPYLEKWGWKGTVEEFLRYWFTAEHQLNDPLINFIHQARQKGISSYLATNNEKYRVEYMTEQLGLGKVFDKIYSSALLGYTKPDIEFFKSIVEELQIDKKEILFWDDSEANIKAAKEFGIHGEVYKNYQHFQQKMKKYLSEGELRSTDFTF